MALGINQERLAQALGLSTATVSRMYGGQYVLKSGSGKEWELASMLVRLFDSLNSVLASEDKARIWLHGENAALGGRPIDLMTRAEGLVTVVHYLAASRGRI